jgi:hypothetical protein
LGILIIIIISTRQRLATTKQVVRTQAKLHHDDIDIDIDVLCYVMLCNI